MSRGHNCYYAYFTWNLFIEIPSNSLFISSRITVGQILDIKLIITTTTIIIIILIIIIMYVTILEHLKAGIKDE